MSRVSLAAMARYCDRLLRTAKVQDYERAAKVRDELRNLKPE